MSSLIRMQITWGFFRGKGSQITFLRLIFTSFLRKVRFFVFVYRNIKKVGFSVVNHHLYIYI